MLNSAIAGLVLFVTILCVSTGTGAEGAAPASGTFYVFGIVEGDLPGGGSASLRFMEKEVEYIGHPIPIAVFQSNDIDHQIAAKEGFLSVKMHPALGQVVDLAGFSRLAVLWSDGPASETRLVGTLKLHAGAHVTDTLFVSKEFFGPR